MQPEWTCYDTKHVQLIGLSIPAALFLFGMLPWLFWKMLSRSENRKKEKWQAAFGWMYNRYDDEHWYWEGVSMMKKIILLATAKLNTAFKNATRGAILSLVMYALIIGLQGWCHPYKDADQSRTEDSGLSANDRLEMWTDVANLLFIVFGLAAESPAFAGTPATIALFSVFGLLFLYVSWFGWQAKRAVVRAELRVAPNPDELSGLELIEHRAKQAMVRQGAGTSTTSTSTRRQTGAQLRNTRSGIQQHAVEHEQQEKMIRQEGRRRRSEVKARAEQRKRRKTEQENNSDSSPSLSKSDSTMFI